MQLQAIEMGYTVLHGVYDKLPGAERFFSKTFSWGNSSHEGAWKQEHNVMHHHYTNVLGKNPDTNFRPARLPKHTPDNFKHRLQFPFLLATLVPNFTFSMNLHFTGLNDHHFENGRANNHHASEERSGKGTNCAHAKALRKYLRYFAWNSIFVPLSVGSMLWKVLLENCMAKTLRDIYSAATIYCGHISEEVANFPEGTRAKGKGE